MPNFLLHATLALSLIASSIFAADAELGDLIPPPKDIDPPFNVVLEMLDGRVLSGRYDPARHVLSTTGPIKSDISVRDSAIKGWHLPKSTSGPGNENTASDAGNTQLDQAKILPCTDPSWKAKHPPIRFQEYKKKEGNEELLRYSQLTVDYSIFDSVNVEFPQTSNANPAILFDGKGEEKWSWGRQGNSIEFSLEKPMPLSAIAVKFPWWGGGARSIGISVNDSPELEVNAMASPIQPATFRDTVLYIRFPKPSEIKKIRMKMLQGTPESSMAQICFLRDKRLIKIIGSKGE